MPGIITLSHHSPEGAVDAHSFIPVLLLVLGSVGVAAVTRRRCARGACFGEDSSQKAISLKNYAKSVGLEKFHTLVRGLRVW